MTRATTAGQRDIAMLEQKGLIENDGGFWRVRFAQRGQLQHLLHLRHQERGLRLHIPPLADEVEQQLWRRVRVDDSGL